MKKEILFIHSAGPQGFHNGSDFLLTYLHDRLDKSHALLHPQMPDPENPHYDSWKTILEKELMTLSNNTLLIGHSLGGSALLKYLSESAYPKTISGLFLIAAPYWGATDWEVEEYTLQDDFSSNLPEIRRVFLYHSMDDEVVPIDHLKYYACQFPSATIRARNGGGHLFSNGLPELIEDINSLW